MYRLVFTYCNNSMGNAYDDECDLDYEYFECQDITYNYKNLEYDYLFDLIKKCVNDLHRVKNGEISICLSIDE